MNDLKAATNKNSLPDNVTYRGPYLVVIIGYLCNVIVNALLRIAGSN